MADRDIRVRLTANVAQLRAAMAQAGREVQTFGREMTGQGKITTAQMERIGRSSMVMAGVIGAGLGLSAKAAIDWQSSWAGVTKTVEGSASQMEALESGLRDLAKELPATHAEIAAVAEAAGALGVQTNAVEGFTKVMIDLGETTDVTAEQAATSMAQIANIMGTAHSDFDRLGSVLVELGNNGASTESEILELANRLAAAGNIAGLAESDVFALASAIASVGVNAEAGGTAMSKVIQSISDSVIDGSEDLQIFAEVAGVTAQQFAASFREDPAVAISSFLDGIGRMEAAGQSTSAVFDTLGLADQRLMRAVRSLGGAQGITAEMIDMANAEWEENNALQTEAEKRYETTASKLEMARNTIVDLAIDVGGVLLPAITGAADAVGTMARGFASLDGAGATAAAGLGLISTAGFGLIASVGILGPKIQALRESLLQMNGTLGPALGRNLGKATLAFGGLGVAVAGLSYVLGRQAQDQADAEERTRAYTDAIREQGSEIGDLTDELNLTSILQGDLGQKLRDAGADLDVFTDAIDTNAEELTNLNDLVRTQIGHGLDGLETALEHSGLAGSDLADELIRLYEEGSITGTTMIDLTDRLGEQAEAHRDGAREAGNQAAAERSVGGEAEAAAPKLGQMAESLGLNAEQAKKAREEFEDLQDAYRAAVDPMFAMLDAIDGNREAQEKLDEVLADSESTAADVNAAYRDVAQSALDVETASRDLAFAVQDGTVSVDQARSMLEEWVAQGLLTEEQAGNVAFQFAVAAEKADSYAGDYVANAFANTATAQTQLDRLLATVQAIARNATITVAAAVNPFFGQRWGGIHEFALGGVTPAHVGHGDLIRYAEPETGGEAFIPRLGNRARSLSILDVAAGWYGAKVMPMARGGVTSFATGGIGEVNQVPTGFELTQVMHQVGAMSDSAFAQHLRARMVQFRRFSSEWVSAQQELARIEEDIADKAAQARMDDYELRREINDNLFELGRLSVEDHLFNLDMRIRREVEFSDEWVALQRERERVLEDVTARERQMIDDLVDVYESAADRAMSMREGISGTVGDLGDVVDQLARIGPGASSGDLFEITSGMMSRAREFEQVMSGLSGLPDDLFLSLLERGPEALGAAKALAGVAPDDLAAWSGELAAIGDRLAGMGAERRPLGELISEEMAALDGSRGARERAMEWAQRMASGVLPDLSAGVGAYVEALGAVPEALSSAFGGGPLLPVNGVTMNIEASPTINVQVVTRDSGTKVRVMPGSSARAALAVSRATA